MLFASFVKRPPRNLTIYYWQCHPDTMTVKAVARVCELPYMRKNGYISPIKGVIMEFQYYVAPIFTKGIE